MSVKIIKISRLALTGQTRPPELRTISSRNSRSALGAAGFTLVEILIVLAIIAMVMSFGLPAIQRVTYQQVNSTTRKFVGIIRTIRNDAILLNRVHRLAFDLDHGVWWVESQKQQLPITAAEAQPEVKQRRNSDEDVIPAPSGNFDYAEKFSTKAVPLPTGVAVNGVLKEAEGLRDTGLVYIHFFPNGFEDQSIIYIAKEGAPIESGYSLVVRPTGGHVEIHNSHVANFAKVQ